VVAVANSLECVERASVRASKRHLHNHCDGVLDPRIRFNVHAQASLLDIHLENEMGKLHIQYNFILLRL